MFESLGIARLLLVIINLRVGAPAMIVMG
jgi:hypothetical protein